MKKAMSDDVQILSDQLQRAGFEKIADRCLDAIYEPFFDRGTIILDEQLRTIRALENVPAEVLPLVLKLQSQVEALMPTKSPENSVYKRIAKLANNLKPAWRNSIMDAMESGCTSGEILPRLLYALESVRNKLENDDPISKELDPLLESIRASFRSYYK